MSVRLHPLFNKNEHDVPEWLRFPHIKTGYRHGGDHYSCFLSMFKYHNECLNAWSMVAGAVVSVCMTWWVFAEYHPTGMNALAFACFCLSYILHTPWSFGYHMFLPISQEVYLWWQRMDASFVFVMSALLTFSLSWNFLSPAMTMLLFLADVTIVCVGIRDIFKPPPNNTRLRRVTIMGLSALGYLIPVFLKLFVRFDIGTLLIPISLMGGALVYAHHFPERLAPGRFDAFGNSHHIMHLGVIVAHIMGFRFVLDNFLRKK